MKYSWQLKRRRPLGLDALVAAGFAVEQPALLGVEKVGEQDLLQDLVVHRRIADRHEHLRRGD